MNSVKDYHTRDKAISDATYTHHLRGQLISSLPVQPATGTHNRYAANERSTWSARYKNAYNPLSAALADVFGVDEVYS